MRVAYLAQLKKQAEHVECAVTQTCSWRKNHVRECGTNLRVKRVVQRSRLWRTTDSLWVGRGMIQGFEALRSRVQSPIAGANCFAPVSSRTSRLRSGRRLRGVTSEATFPLGGATKMVVEQRGGYSRGIGLRREDMRSCARPGSCTSNRTTPLRRQTIQEASNVTGACYAHVICARRVCTNRRAQS